MCAVFSFAWNLKRRLRTKTKDKHLLSAAPEDRLFSPDYSCFSLSVTQHKSSVAHVIIL